MSQPKMHLSVTFSYAAIRITGLNTNCMYNVASRMVRWMCALVAVLLPCAADAEDPLPTGMRRLVGRHLELITDVPSDPEVDVLPTAYDFAIEQIGDYFGVAHSRLAGWRVTGYLMAQPDRFRQLGMWSADLPDFRFGFQRGNELWGSRSAKFVLSPSLVDP